MTERKTNLEAMDLQMIDSLAEQTGTKLSEILNNAKVECDKVLARMGLTINLGYEIQLKGVDNSQKE
jgi:hypothetical protein